jgi:diguanylate cyclase (GGDEF)-like protein
LNLLATTDQLTQLLNRRAVMARFDEIVEQYFSEEISFGMLLLDIDFFKKVNDTYGHNGGDTVLQQFAGCLKNVMRATDVIGRMGGEEFIAIVQSTSINDFHNICERIRTSVEALSCDHDGIIIKVTTSGGTYFSSELETNIKEMINIADQRLYGAKKAGRNRIQHIDTKDA